MIQLIKKNFYLIILFFIFSTLIGYICYISNDKKKETKTEAFKRCSLPAFGISLIMVGLIYYFKNMNSKDIMLEGETFFD